VADRHWTNVAGVYSGNFSDTNHWSATRDGAGGASVPTAADNAIIDPVAPGTYTVTVDAAANCLDIDCSGSGGTLTLAPTFQLTVNGNVKWQTGGLVSGANQIVFNGIGKTITSNGVTTNCSVTVAGAYTQADAFAAGGSFQYQMTSLNSSWTSAGFNFTTGAANFSSAFARTLNLSGSLWVHANANALIDFTNTTGLSFTPPTTLRFTGVSGTITFNGGGLTWLTVETQGASALGGILVINGANSYTNLTLVVGVASKLSTVKLGANQTVTGTFKYLGATPDATHGPLLIQSDVLGTPRTITAGSIDAASNFTDFQDIAGAGAAAPFATGTRIGDCLGNSGITFTASVTQFWKTTTTGAKNWDTVGNWFLATNGGGGAGRVPLPQDDVVFDVSAIGAASTTINTNGMPRLGRSITFAGVANAPQFMVSGGINTALYGSLTLGIGMTSGFGSSISFNARSNATITCAGLNIQSRILSNLPTGSTFFLGDAFSNSATDFVLASGNLDTNGFSMTTPQMNLSVAGTRTVDLRGSTITLTGTGNVWNVNATGLTLNQSTSTIKITDATAAAKTFGGVGKTYNNVWFSGLSVGHFIITGANTFNDLKVDPGNVLLNTAGTTQTVASLTASGNAPGGGDAVVGRLFGIAGGYFSTPDSAAASVTGDIDISVKVAMADWTPTVENVLLSKYLTAGNQISYAFDVQGSTGNLRLYTSPNGSTLRTNTSTAATGFVDGTVHWVRVTRSAATGDVKFYTCPSEDGVTWVQLGTTVASAVEAIFDGTAGVLIGSLSDPALPLQGSVYRAQVLNGIAGSVVVDFNPASYATSTTWVSATGETWTINGTAMVMGTNQVGIGSLTAANHTLAKSGAGGRIVVRNASINRSSATPAITFYAPGDLNQGNNTGWIFAEPFNVAWSRRANSLIGSGAQA
jgi:hypothetical protein